MLVALIFVQACRGYLVKESTAFDAAETMGFTNVEVIDDHRMSPSVIGGCSNSDDAAFELRARNPQGQTVDIVACCGWPFKGCTIRVK